VRRVGRRLGDQLAPPVVPLPHKRGSRAKASGVARSSACSSSKAGVPSGSPRKVGMPLSAEMPRGQHGYRGRWASHSRACRSLGLDTVSPFGRSGPVNLQRRRLVHFGDDNRADRILDAADHLAGAGSSPRGLRRMSVSPLFTPFLDPTLTITAVGIASDIPDLIRWAARGLGIHCGHVPEAFTACRMVCAKCWISCRAAARHSRCRRPRRPCPAGRLALRSATGFGGAGIDHSAVSAPPRWTGSCAGPMRSPRDAARPPRMLVSYRRPTA